MIRINEDFEFERYTYGWTLHWYQDGLNKKTKQRTRNSTQTYYSTLDQLCQSVIDKSAGGAVDINGVVSAINNASAELSKAIKSAGIEDRK